MNSNENGNPAEIRLDCPDFSDRKVGADLLFGWMRERLARNREITLWSEGDSRVTVLSYYFWKDDPGAERLNAIECAILEAWRHCGRMRSVVVADRETQALSDLVGRYAPWLELQVEPTLVPGKLFTMSVDCNSRLYTRFRTEYVLIVQEDGFPLRSGLEEYVGEHDFIGGPNVRDKWYLQAVCKIFKCLACNGGFSLRSRSICELGAYYWKRKYHKWPECDAVSEDYYYTKTLPLRESSYRRQVRMPTFAQANDFSFDAVFPFVGTRPPFGFHTPLAFKLLHESGMVNMATY